MTELIANIQASSEINDKVDEEDENIEEEEDLETTSARDMEDFQLWAKSQAVKDLSSFKDFTKLMNIESLRVKISSLNSLRLSSVSVAVALI